MQLEKFTVNIEDNLLEALIKIENNNKGFICVVDDLMQLKGTITDGDIRRELIKNKNLNVKIKDFLSGKFEFLNVGEKFEVIVEKFKQNKIMFLPVIDNKNILQNILTKKQLHEILLQGEILSLSMDFEQYDNNEIFEIYYRPWGFYKTVVLSEFVQMKVLQVFPHQMLSLQYHKHREEHWIVVKGSGQMTIGESVKEIKEGSYIFIPKGCMHRVKNVSEQNPLIIAEVQLGDYFGEDDIIRIEDSYGRK